MVNKELIIKRNRELFERELGKDWDKDHDNRMVFESSVEFDIANKTIQEML